MRRMPSLPVIASAHKVSLKLNFGGFMIGWGVISTTTDLASLATAISAQVTAAMWAYMPSNLHWEEMHIFRFDGVTPTYVQALVGAQWAGAATVIDAMIAPAVLVSQRTATRGPWGRGRVYLPCASEETVASGTLNTATQASMQTAWNTFRTNCAGANCAMGVISMSTNPGPPARVPSIRPVISVAVESALATQRRRQDRLR